MWREAYKELRSMPRELRYEARVMRENNSMYPLTLHSQAINFRAAWMDFMADMIDSILPD